jgi:hypothetical protein
MRRILIPALSFVLSIATVMVAYAQFNVLPPPNPNCAPFNGQVPAGQQNPTTIEPQYSIWCYSQPDPGAPTRLSGANDWIDNWDNSGPAIQNLRDGEYDYRRFDFTQRERGVDRIAVGYFINVNHWMPDIGDTSDFRLSGGSMLSPNRSFNFENGKMVIEADMAAGSAGMGGADAFYEIDVSPARAPTGITIDPLYGYGQFGGAGSLGCRFERDADGGHIVCAMYDTSRRDAGGTCVDKDSNFRDLCAPGNEPGRVWETQGVGTGYTAPVVEGGYPGYPIPGSTLHSRDFWRQCADDDAPTPNSLDLYCRDRMRMELTRDSIHIYVNAALVYSVEGLYAVNPHNGADNRLPASWFSDPGLSVYYTSWINGGIHHPTRWHWDRLAINPHAADGSIAPPTEHPNFCFGREFNTCPPGGEPNPATPTPGVATSVPVATSSPVATSTATSAPATPTRAPATATATRPPSTSATGTPVIPICRQETRIGDTVVAVVPCTVP